MTNISEDFQKQQEIAAALSKAFAPQVESPEQIARNTPPAMVFFMDVTNAIGKPAGEGSVEVNKLIIDTTLPVEDRYLSYAADWEVVAAPESPIGPTNSIPTLKRRA